jgi:YHS domain-containing protein
VVLAIERKQAVPGHRKHGVYYAGRVYLFSDEANLEKFSKNPRYYAEQIVASAGGGSLAVQQAR